MPERHGAFGRVKDDDKAHFRAIVGPGNVFDAKDDVSPYVTDWLHKYKAQGESIVLRPKTVEETSAILAHCSAKRLAVVPQGGNTGLVGGSVPVHDEVVLSTSRMNSILSFDPSSSVVVCEAGVVLEALDAHLREVGHIVPLDLGAKGSCQIGGNVSTNAGGIRFLRYGSLHGSVVGLEVVMADGQVLDLLSGVRKDNTGYDLKQLFIGAEGTLGVITKVALVAPARPLAQTVALFSVPSFDAVLALLKLARSQLGEALSAFEHFDRTALTMVENAGIGTCPIDGSAQHYVLIETSGANASHDAEKLEVLLGMVFDEAKPVALDGTLATSDGQAKSIWALRETIAEALSKAGGVYKYDLSLPTEEFYKCVEVMRERFADLPEVTVCGYGHVGDGNLHLNIVAPKYDDAKYLSRIEPFVYEYISELRGSVSAEHGVGVMKPPYLHYSKPDLAIQLMKSIKSSFDPLGILNPYKVLPK